MTTTALDTREQFAATATDLIRSDPRVALVYAEISGRYFTDIAAERPGQVVNVGIREQLLINVGAGLALTGMRPIVHTFASFLVERPFEQIKLGFGHQDVDGVLVSTGASYDVSSGGRTHQSPGDVALIDTLPGWSIHIPGTAAEVDRLLRQAISQGGRHYIRTELHENHPSAALIPGSRGFQRIREGRQGVVVAVGPSLTDALRATEGLDVTVLYANTIRPFDAAALRTAVTSTIADVVLVEPYLAGTSAWAANHALLDIPHRILSLGTRRDHELRRYGTPAEHRQAHGLDPASIRRSISEFMTGT